MRHAAVVSSSFMSGWPTSSSAKSTLRTIIRSMTTAATQPGSSSGSCCCRKGKCKEWPELSYEVNGCLIPDGYNTNSGMRTMFFQAYGHLRRVRRVFATTVAHSDLFRTSPSYIMFRRGVASAASIPKRQAATLALFMAQSQAQSTRLLNFRDSSHGHSKLEEVWDAFCAFRSEEDTKGLDTRELLRFGGMILRDTDVKGEVISKSAEWGDRLERLLDELRKRTPFQSPLELIQLECLAIVSGALRGQFDEALASFGDFIQKEPSFGAHSRWVVDTFKHVLLSLLRGCSASRAVHFYIDNYFALKQVLTKGSGARHTSPRMYIRFFPELSAILRAMESPAAFLASVSHWEKSDILNLGMTMLHVLCKEGLADDALGVYEELCRQGISVRYFMEHALVRALTKAERYERANVLYLDIAPKLSVDPEERSYVATGLYLFAHQGDVERAEECFESLSAKGGVHPQEITLVMHASAVRGDTKRVEELFKGFFGDRDQKSESGLQKPNSIHYSTLINACAVRDDIDGMNRWLGRMLDDGCTPDIAIYNIVLKGIAQRDDFKSIEALLDQMRSSGVPPNVTSYTTVIKVLARRRDVLGAEALFKRMIRDGIALDRMAVTALMNAHVEAGNWRGVIRVFDFISASQLKDLKLGIEVFNTLLKAYVLIGAPLEVVTTLFQRLERKNIKPTNRTFALLIQSACDSNRMDIAARLFTEMEDLEKDWTTRVGVTKEVLTILMAGYLRQGNRTQARAIYDDMQRRGIQPTAYTYASILRSYSNADFEENVKIAREFLNSLVSRPSEQRAWVEPASGRESALAFVYAPLMNAHAKMMDVETAEKHYQEFIDHDEKPTIGILALLMDAYRRVGDIEGVQRVWPQIYDFAVGRTEEVDKLLDTIEVENDFMRSRRRGDLLCIPLSIYIDALSHAGQHIEIAHTWNKLREAGFQFDANNWNHLVVALVRAGQPLRAFEVVEKVILPYQMQSHAILRTRPEKVDSPLLFEDEEARAEIEDEPFIRPIERSGQRRPSLLERLHRRFAGRGEMREVEDFAHQLQLMQQISPEWNVWRPHQVTMQVLARVLEQLDSGRLIRPTKPRTRSPPSDVKDNPDTTPQEEEEEREIYLHTPSEEEAREARSILNKILAEYPQTIVSIDRWETEAVQAAARQSRRLARQTTNELREMGRMSSG